jgi:transcriptional regulator with PAS, ATPase and Fis domain
MWLIAVRLARAQGKSAPALPADPEATMEVDVGTDERREIDAECSLERAAIAREEGDLSRARDLLDHAREAIEVTGSPRLAACFELEVGLFAGAAADLEQARKRIRNAIEMFASNGLRRDEGRATIRYAELLATYADQVLDESAAAALGRAQAVLGAAATWRDRLAIRTGFHSFGRRVFDRVMTEGTVSRIEAFERARGTLLSALAVVSDSGDRALTELESRLDHDATRTELHAHVGRARLVTHEALAATNDAVSNLDRSVRDLIDLIGAALVERDRLRVLLVVFSELDQVTDFASLPPLVAKLAARVLDADQIVVALERGGELLPLGRIGEPMPGDEEGWKKAAVAATELTTNVRVRSDPSQLSARGHDTLCGPVIAVPLRRSGIAGALYADKLRRNGQFRDQDLAIAHLLADYVALAFGKLRAREDERFALHQLAVTLDAIRDGVLACDENGVVTSVNAAALRMLRLSSEHLLGKHVEHIADLAPLWPLLTAPARVDGSVVRLPHGSFVVSARDIGEEEGRGFVATLVELDRAQKMAQRLSATRARYGFHDIVGTSPALQAAIAMAKRASSIDATVLITGESGTGKEVIAQAIHSSGPRGGSPFVGVNVAAVPRDLLEAELFGYEKGAFTGARAEGNPGKFELAEDGTILLDEIGDMPLDMQAKLLRVLQERVITRLGGRKEIPVPARVIATTHRDLEQLVDEGTFRMDLLFRLRVLAIELPPLRERPEDIAQLAKQYLVRFAEQQRKRLRDFGPRVLDELERYDWPGNVRELANVMEAEVSLAAPDLEVLERLLTRLVGRFRVPGAASTGEWKAVPPAQEEPIRPLAEVEKKTFLRALERLQSVSKAAEALGVSKVTYYAKLRSWGMHPKDRDADETGPVSARWVAAISDAPPSSRHLPDDELPRAPKSQGRIGPLKEK